MSDPKLITLTSPSKYVIRIPVFFSGPPLGGEPQGEGGASELALEVMATSGHQACEKLAKAIQHAVHGPSLPPALRAP